MEDKSVVTDMMSSINMLVIKHNLKSENLRSSKKMLSSCGGNTKHARALNRYRCVKETVATFGVGEVT